MQTYLVHDCASEVIVQAETIQAALELAQAQLKFAVIDIEEVPSK